MTTHFDTYQYIIGSHWICAIEYGPGETDLTDEETAQLEAFLETLPDSPGHWTYSEGTDFARDEISGLYADCIEATYHVRTDA